MKRNNDSNNFPYEINQYLGLLHSIKESLLKQFNLIKIHNFKDFNPDSLDKIGESIMDNYVKNIFKVFAIISLNYTYIISNKDGLFNLLKEFDLEFESFEIKFNQLLLKYFELIRILKLARDKGEHKKHKVSYGIPLLDIQTIEHNLLSFTHDLVE